MTRFFPRTANPPFMSRNDPDYDARLAPEPTLYRCALCGESFPEEQIRRRPWAKGWDALCCVGCMVEMDREE